MTGQAGTNSAASDTITKALFRNITNGNANGPEIPVHFNPESLEYQLQNNMDRRGSGNSHKQYISESTGKLTMQLVFDTTVSGKDVRIDTEKLQALMKPTAEGQRRVAHVVQFEWGAFRFRGTFESYKETLDFFSATGVPLRATANITLAQQEGVFEPTQHGENVAVAGATELSPTPGQSIDQAGVSRQDAAQNGEESLRRLSGAPLSLTAGVQLKPPSIFASAAFGVSLSAGINLELGIGLGLGVSASFGLGVSANIGANVNLGLGGAAFGPSTDRRVTAAQTAATPFSGSPLQLAAARAAATNVSTATGARAGSNQVLSPADAQLSPQLAAAAARADNAARAAAAFAARAGTSLPDVPAGPAWGSQASAGMPATFGAFAGLSTRRPETLTRQRSRPVRATPPREVSLHTDPGALFDVGGRAVSAGTNGLTADVGSRATLNDRIRFDEE